MPLGVTIASPGRGGCLLTSRVASDNDAGMSFWKQETRRDYQSICDPLESQDDVKYLGGGRASYSAQFKELAAYTLPEVNYCIHPDQKLTYHDHVTVEEVRKYMQSEEHVVFKMTILQTLEYALIYKCGSMFQLHGYPHNQASQMSRLPRQVVEDTLRSHSCYICDDTFSVFLLYPPKKVEKQTTKDVRKSTAKKTTNDDEEPITFPPQKVSMEEEHRIITKFCNDVNLRKTREEGCAVCGCLTLVKDLVSMDRIRDNLGLLVQQGVTRLPRSCITDPIREIESPILAPNCHRICKECNKSLVKGERPKISLANGLWIGEVPPVLSKLRFAERILVSRVRHNYCVVRVASGGRKLKANAIMFSNLMQKIYNKLPPLVSELDEVLAYIYTGPAKPTHDDLKRTPLLVRRNAVSEALEWLILNHADYHDVIIDKEALNEYPEEGAPVTILFTPLESNKNPESQSLDDMEVEDGTDSGDCLFTVHGLTGNSLSDISSTKVLRAEALRHLNSGGKVLAIGHNDAPESIYNNPHLYPQMFPCLFPYGLGGLGMASGIGETMHKRHLLMYFDKRFQIDNHFPLIAFNHEQVKSTTKSAFVLADSNKFDAIAPRILGLNVAALDRLIEKMSTDGSHIEPITDDEKDCFKLLNDIECVAGRVNGTSTSKKVLRNEIWSLIAYRGAPSWFITFSPADVKNPLCIYWASTDISINIDSLSRDEKMNIVSRNPVAAARFFHFVVQMFIKHVLGVGSKDRGLYGRTSAYYGTVEQQGRLTLHLHMLLWIMGSLKPQEIRERIQQEDSDFITAIKEYLESVNEGDFVTGDMTYVKEQVDIKMGDDSYKDPTQTLATKPPRICKNCCKKDCTACSALQTWWNEVYNAETDDILLKSNVHTCSSGIKKNGEVMKNKDYTGCLNNKWKTCKARFPRPLYQETKIDTETGRIDLKKREPFINTFTRVVSYVLRCNSDVTCLHSGTAVKAVVAYVSDYISKYGLKTHVIFETIRGIYRRNSETLNTSAERAETARQLLTRIVNSLTVKMEIGAPMASMYLLGNPDHYTNHIFKPFYWRSYVNYIENKLYPEGLRESEEDSQEDKVLILASNRTLYPSRVVDDYIFRPRIYSGYSLYDWVRLARRERKRHKANSDDTMNSPVDLETQDETDVDIDSEEEAEEVLDDSDIEEMMSEDGRSANSTRSVSEEDNEEDPEFRHGENVDNESRSSSGFTYLDGHPLSGSHVVRCVKDNGMIVPTFIGGSVPRDIEGSREYYCMSMLIFFKPWRRPADLKDETDNWDETFRAYSFSEKHSEVMNNFRVKYECLDARDDFNAMRRKMESEKQQATSSEVEEGMPIPAEWRDEIDAENHYDNVVEVDQPIGDDDPRLVGNGQAGSRRKEDRASIKVALFESGWLKVAPKDSPVIGPQHENLVPALRRSGTEWRAVVAAKRQEVIALRIKAKTKSLSGVNVENLQSGFTPNIVRVVGITDLDDDIARKRELDLIGDVCLEFNLNKEQERAYRIASEYICHRGEGNLKMYIGGMGGTGKTRVLEAIAKLLECRGESQRLVVMAPTGTAAALLGGSTYHYILGMRDGEDHEISTTLLSQIKDRLQGVDFIFLDEVSMLSCYDMYRVCERLAIACGREDIPFGGLNIIFAGDFAQLPPVAGGENSSLYSGSIGSGNVSATNLRGQKAAIGKAMWHQINTVVILRQNMRQTEQTVDDTRLRTALENMRYKSCTVEDIAFLKTKIAGFKPGQPDLSAPLYRHVSIITSWNDKKDEINELGCLKFAADTGQTLYTFYSIDEPISVKRKRKKKDKSGSKGRRTQKKFPLTHISVATQERLWNLPPSTNDHQVQGKVRVCLGMPIMIRYNEATELCMTRGQEGTIAGWQAIDGPKGKPVLDVLFVRLTKPPQKVQFEGLPENVVPLTRAETTITFAFDSGWSTTITRKQILFLPNFAMTDFASQGKTRPENVVNLTNCPNHQSYYTCLSRSSSAAHTIIVQGFNVNKITGGASGWLRQEFRDLEILDYITQLNFENKLPQGIIQQTRRSTILAFRKLKGKNVFPETLHPSIRSADYTSQTQGNSDSIQWRVIRPEKKDSTQIKESVDEDIEMDQPNDLREISLRVKRKREDSSDKLTKMPKLFHNTNAPQPHQTMLVQPPVGLVWDSRHYSCAYDTLFTILRHVWITEPAAWSLRMTSINALMDALSRGFHHLLWDGTSSFENVRDQLRVTLNNMSPTTFPFGPSLISMYDLAVEFLRRDVIISRRQKLCNSCGYEDPNFGVLNHNLVVSIGYTDKPSLRDWFLSPEEPTHYTCRNCSVKDVVLKFEYLIMPHLIYVDLRANDQELEISESLTICKNGQFFEFALRGVFYFGAQHFTGRLVSENMTWFYDGMVTRGVPGVEGRVLTRGLNHRGATRAIGAMYARNPVS